MMQTILFLILTVLVLGALIWIILLSILQLIGIIRKKSGQKRLIRLKRTAIFLSLTIVLNTGLIILSQITASTPPILDENGMVPPDSIAELVKVELNGRKEWISLRGWDKSKPVLLFLAGGPGGTQMAAVRHELKELEKHFVVVNWDQPGSGKSYYAERNKSITADTYIQDGYALTEYLKARFSQEKIYLMGESWGSALGIFLIDKYPESYFAFIGTAQMIDFEETERLDYKKAMEIARERNDEKTIRRLENNGVPPYYGENITFKSAVYLNYLNAAMNRNPDIHNPGYETLRDIFSPEYGLLDKINFARGIINTYSSVYQQLYDIDLREDYVKLEVPVYLFLGRHDLNAPVSLAEEYFELLDAPYKEIVWFEHSGHSPWINERDKFVEEVCRVFKGA